MHTRLLLPLALVSSLLIGACTGTGGAGASDPNGILPGSPGDPPTLEGLDGRSFLSTAAVGRTLVPGSQVRLSFLEGRIGASAGCNSMGGDYTIDGDRLVAARLASTQMACAPALMEQDLWLAGLLDGSTIDLAGDTLTLAKDGVRLSLLDRKVADPDRPFLGTRWVVDGLVSDDAVSSLPAGVVAALTFSPGRVDVEAGCNRGGGDVTATETTLAFGPIALTKIACEGGAMEVERTVLAVLGGEVRYAIEAGGLLLDAGPVGLMLRAAP